MSKKMERSRHAPRFSTSVNADEIGDICDVGGTPTHDEPGHFDYPTGVGNFMVHHSRNGGVGGNDGPLAGAADPPGGSGLTFADGVKRGVAAIRAHGSLADVPMLIVVHLAGFFFASILAVWHIVLVNVSLREGANLAAFQPGASALVSTLRMRDAVDDVFWFARPVYAAPLDLVARIHADFDGTLWNCGGALQMAVPLSLLVSGVFVRYVIRPHWLFRLAVAAELCAARIVPRDAGPAATALRAVLGRTGHLAAAALVVAMEAFAVFAGLAFRHFATGADSCDWFDRRLLVAGRIASHAALVVFLFLTYTSFAGRVTGASVAAAALSAARGVWRFALLTVGLVDNDAAEAYGIRDAAHAASRGLFSSGGA
jgi:hypothetical protein